MTHDAPLTTKNLFIAGTPGVGKTTLIKEVTLPYRNQVAGFYTEEIKEGRERRGFLLKVLGESGSEPKEGILAAKGTTPPPGSTAKQAFRLQPGGGAKSSPKIGKYRVNLDVIEGIGVSVLSRALKVSGRLLVIDEIGSMEVLSNSFRETLLQSLQSPDHPVLATIRLKSQPFTNHVKRMQDTEMIHLTRDNFADVKEKVRRWLDEKIAHAS